VTESRSIDVFFESNSSFTCVYVSLCIRSTLYMIYTHLYDLYSFVYDLYICLSTYTSSWLVALATASP